MLVKWICLVFLLNDLMSGVVNVKYNGNGYYVSFEDVKGIVKQMIVSGYKEWDNDNDWQVFVWIWEYEFGWWWNVENFMFGVYGILQFYFVLKFVVVGNDWKDNVVIQIKWGLQYIK